MKKGFLHWSARIICMIAILFLSLFAFDSFTPGMPLRKQILAFVIHLIPNFILIGLLIFAWIKELAGGIVFIAVALIAGLFLFWWNYNMNHSVSTSLLIVALLTLPFLLSGILFVLSSRRKRRDMKTAE